MKTVRVRIAIAVGGDADDGYVSDVAIVGCGNDDPAKQKAISRLVKDGFSVLRTCFIEADVPIPEPETIEGQVKP